MAQQEYESVASAIEMSSKPSNTYTITVTSLSDQTSNSKFASNLSIQIPEDNEQDRDYLEIPMTIDEKEGKDESDDDEEDGNRLITNDTMEETPEPDDYSHAEEKISEFNKYTVCLDGEGPILTLQQIQTKKEEYLLEHDNWKRKCPPKLLVPLLVMIGLAVYGLFLMVTSNFNNQLALILSGVSCAVIIMLTGLIIMKFCEKHENFVEYYERSGNGLRFNTRNNSITTVAFEVNYGYRPDKKGNKRFTGLHEGRITQKQTAKICEFSQVSGIGREIVKRRDKPDASHIYINYKDKELSQWKSEMQIGESVMSKSTFLEMQSIMKSIDEDWLNKITVKRDKMTVIKRSSSAHSLR